MAPGLDPVSHGSAIELTSKPDFNPEKEVGVLVQDVGGDEFVEQQDAAISASKSTRDDLMGMRRMGKDQQLVRTFRQM